MITRPLAVAFVITVALGAGALAEDCPGTCLQAGYEAACAVPSASEKGCLDWLEELQRSSTQDDLDARLMIGAAYLALARLTESDAVTQGYRRRAAETYQGVVAFAPETTRGWVGLAAVAESETDRIHFLRRAYESDPGNLRRIMGLSAALTSSGEPQHLLEATSLLLNAYDSMPDGPQRWRLGRNLWVTYRQASRDEVANAFALRMRDDLRIDERLQQLSNRDAGGVEAAAENISILCSQVVADALRANYCLRGVQMVVSAALDAEGFGDFDTFSELADTASRGAALVAEEQWRVDDSAALRTLEEQLQRLIERGPVSKMVSEVYAWTTNDNNGRVRALERAVEVGPADSALVARLAMAYMDIGLWRQAKEKLVDAIALLPSEADPYWRSQLVALLATAEGQLQMEGRSTESQNP